MEQHRSVLSDTEDNTPTLSSSIPMTDVTDERSQNRHHTDLPKSQPPSRESTRPHLQHACRLNSRLLDRTYVGRRSLRCVSLHILRGRMETIECTTTNIATDRWRYQSDEASDGKTTEETSDSAHRKQSPMTPVSTQNDVPTSFIHNHHICLVQGRYGIPPIP